MERVDFSSERSSVAHVPREWVAEDLNDSTKIIDRGTDIHALVTRVGGDRAVFHTLAAHNLELERRGLTAEGAA